MDYSYLLVFVAGLVLGLLVAVQIAKRHCDDRVRRGMRIATAYILGAIGEDDLCEFADLIDNDAASRGRT